MHSFTAHQQSAGAMTDVSTRPFGERKALKEGFVVIVTGTLAPGHLQRFTDAFAPLAQHVAQHEDGCLAYELSVKSGEPDAFVIYERYTSKEYVDNVHWQSQPFKDFQAAVAALKLEWVSPLSATTYTERGIGF